MLASVATPDVSATAGSGTDADGSDATDASPTGPASSPKPKRSVVVSWICKICCVNRTRPVPEELKNLVEDLLLLLLLLDQCP